MVIRGVTTTMVSLYTGTIVWVVNKSMSEIWQYSWGPAYMQEYKELQVYRLLDKTNQALSDQNAHPAPSKNH